jgi:hypothetical protein
MASLVQRIIAASGQIGALEADARNTQQKYDYLSADYIIQVAGNALRTNGVMVLPSVLERRTVRYDRGVDKYIYHVEVDMQFTVLDEEGGSLGSVWTSSGVDYASPDKAEAKAITTGHKYFLMKLLMISIGNPDGEHEAPQKEVESAVSPAHEKMFALLGDAYRSSDQIAKIESAISKTIGSDVARYQIDTRVSILRQYADARSNGADHAQAVNEISVD